VAAPQSPIGSRRRLGAELRRLRNRAGLTLDAVADQMTCSTSKISRLETGKGIPKVPDVRELMRIYGVGSDTERDMLLRLVHDGREPGWWEPLTDGVQSERYLLDPGGRYVALENDATAILSFDMAIFHGLLQSEAYTRAVIAPLLAEHSASEIDSLIKIRIKRQEALWRTDPPPPKILAVVDEVVFHRQVGSLEVMAAQLEHIREAARHSNVEIRVMPFAAGVHRAHGGDFVLLEIPAALGSSIVYIESHAGDRFLDDKSDVELYREIHADALRHALSREESQQYIRRCLDDARHKATHAQ
jgi:transcriptional regulator with XRE-family HTH domain